MRDLSRRKAALGLVAEAVIMVGAYLAYEAVRRLVAADSGDAFVHASRIIEVEQELGIFLEPSLQGLVVDHHWLVTLFNWIYVWGYLPVIAAAALYLYVRHHEFYTRYRNAFLVSGAAGLLIFAFLPVAPPRMFPEFGFVDTVRDHSTVYQQFERSNLVNEFAAVPSFHFGWILLVGLAIAQTNQHAAARALAFALPVLMLAAIVFTANHYLIDAAIGGVLVLGSLVAVRATEGIDWCIVRERVLGRSAGCGSGGVAGP